MGRVRALTTSVARRRLPSIELAPRIKSRQRRYNFQPSFRFCREWTAGSRVGSIRISLRRRESEREKDLNSSGSPSLPLPRSRPGFGWLRLAARQRSVRKFSADKLARIVRIILQGLPVLTAAGGLSWHNLSLPRPPSPPLSLSLPLSSPIPALPPPHPPPPILLLLSFPRLYFSSFRLVLLSRPVRQHRLWLARPTERLGTRSSWKRGNERLEECGSQRPEYNTRIRGPR